MESSYLERFGELFPSLNQCLLYFLDPEDDDASDDQLLSEYLSIHDREHKVGSLKDIERVLENPSAWSDAIVHFADYWWPSEAEQRKWLEWLHQSIARNLEETSL